MSEELVHGFYSNGKLLITGEYLVLHGAVSLAVPTKAGQSLNVYKRPGAEVLEWRTSVQSKPWFQAGILPDILEIQETDKPEVAARLLHMLKAAAEIKGNSDWLGGVSVVSEIGFDIEWGLGSSSSLISNIAWWAGIDPFRLSNRISQGSGYDIACARSEGPILFNNDSGSPVVEKIQFLPGFSGNLAFVYLGRKQDSSESVKNFLNNALVREKDIIRISEISQGLVNSDNLREYEDLLTEHESILSRVLDRPPVKEVLFRDYPGIVKSLGAWGGDFVHVSLRGGLETAREYFAGKGLKVLIPYSEMLKKSHYGK